MVEDVAISVPGLGCDLGGDRGLLMSVALPCRPVPSVKRAHHYPSPSPFSSMHTARAHAAVLPLLNQTLVQCRNAARCNWVFSRLSLIQAPSSQSAAPCATHLPSLLASVDCPATNHFAGFTAASSVLLGRKTVEPGEWRLCARLSAASSR